MTRVKLPDRRAAESVSVEHGGTRFTVTIGFYPDGRPGEVFIHGIRTGSNLDALLADACVVMSCLIQHGADPRHLAASMGRLGSVEAVVQGAPQAVQALIEWARQGPPRARVDAVQVSEAPAQVFNGFERRDTA